MRFAAIDIGSNAVRLLLCNVLEADDGPVFKKAELIRMPLRLGEDAFRYKKITKQKEDRLLKVMNAFKLLIEAFEAVDYKAYATAALRDAQNGDHIVEKIKRQCNLEVEIIDGKNEAQVIYSNHIAEHLEHDSSYLYIDVGGGSTEITLFSDNSIVASQSFNIGTIRMLQEKVSKETWNGFKEWIKNVCADYKAITAIGSGGNINKIYKMIARKEKLLHFDNIKIFYDEVQQMTYDERIMLLNLNPDRADVIVPAARIFLTVMKAAGIKEIVVPQIGLSDGIIHQLYEKHKAMPQLF